MTQLTHDYNGITINQQSQDGYINLNQMAEATGKRIDKWLENKTTKELFAEFYRQQSTTWNSPSTTWNSPSTTPNSPSTTPNSPSTTPNSPSTTPDMGQSIPALITYEGNNGGTWAHPDIALQFAQWCSAAFALQVSRWVREWIATNKPPEMSKEHLQLEAVKINAANKLAIAKINAEAKIEIERMKLEVKQKTARPYVYVPPASTDEDSDNWYEQISDYIKDKSEVKTMAIAKWLGIEKPDSAHTLKRIAAILRGLGFKDVHTNAGKIWKKRSQPS